MRKKRFVALLAFALLVTAVCIALPTFADGETPVVRIAAANLSLDDNIYMSFSAYYDNIDTETDSYGLIIWKALQETGSYTYANAQENENALVYTGSTKWEHSERLDKDIATYYYGIAAKEMADMVYAQAWACKDGSYYYSPILPYSVTTYAQRKLGLVQGVEGTADESLKELLKGMLTYGALAQKHFDYNVDNLATDALNSYTVTFKDWDGTELKTETVYHGQKATAPTEPTREGYTFAGWDKTFTNVKENLTVTAQYTADSTTPSVTIENKTAKSGDTVTVTFYLKNNPGILGAEMVVQYDDGLTLTDSTSGTALSYLEYKKPGRYKKGCNFFWGNSEEIGEVADGILLTLTFTVSDEAQYVGQTLHISASCEDGLTFGEQNTPIILSYVSGGITVTE